MTPIVVLAAVLAQAPTPAAGDGVQLERIRKALEHQPAITTESGTDEGDRPVFRMSVRGAWLEKAPWDDWTNVPSYIRPWWRGDHNDYLMTVTPEEFRSATMYPVGIPIVPLLEALSKRIRVAHRKSQEEGAREEVRKALAELLACRADPARPGC